MTAPRKPTPITSRQRPIRLKDLPARIRVADHDPANPYELSFSLELYEVPEGGGEVLGFERKKARAQR